MKDTATAEQFDDRVVFHTPYDPDFIDHLKARIDSTWRRWDAEQRTWTVKAPYVDRAIDIADRCFDLTIYDFRRQKPTTPPPPPHSCLEKIIQEHPDFAALHLLPSAPAEVMHAAFRALMHSAHPDRGGSDQRAVELLGVRARLVKHYDRQTPSRGV